MTTIVTLSELKRDADSFLEFKRAMGHPYKRGATPRPWCQGFHSAMNLNIKRWKRLLDLDNPNHGLLLPILIYCVDKKKGRPVLGKPRPGRETAHFIEHEAYKDTAFVIPALRELHYVTHYDLD
jgi:hypothetical protein